MKKIILIIGLVFTTIVFFASCAHKDCQGNKHKVRTEDGGWL